MKVHSIKVTIVLLICIIPCVFSNCNPTIQIRNPNTEDPDSPIRVIHIKGKDHYELGRAHGKLLKQEVQLIYNYFISKELEKYGDKIKEVIKGYHIPAEYISEMKGLSVTSTLGWASSKRDFNSLTLYLGSSSTAMAPLLMMPK